MYWLYDKAGHNEKKGVLVGSVLFRRKNLLFRKKRYLKRKNNYVEISEQIILLLIVLDRTHQSFSDVIVLQFKYTLTT